MIPDFICDALWNFKQCISPWWCVDQMTQWELINLVGSWSAIDVCDRLCGAPHGLVSITWPPLIVKLDHTRLETESLLHKGMDRRRRLKSEQ